MPNTEKTSQAQSTRRVQARSSTSATPVSPRVDAAAPFANSAELNGRLQHIHNSVLARDLLYLQRAIGNRAVSNLVQASREEQTLPYAEGGNVSPQLEERIRNTQSGGTPLAESIQRRLEPVIQADLSPIKVHKDDDAIQLSRALGAKAFTVGTHIYYGKGQSPNDLKLTAHESVHAIQQGAVQRIQRYYYLEPNNAPASRNTNEGSSSHGHPSGGSNRFRSIGESNQLDSDTTEDNYFHGPLSTGLSESHTIEESSRLDADTSEDNYFHGPLDTGVRESHTIEESNQLDSDENGYYFHGNLSRGARNKMSRLPWRLWRGKKKAEKAKAKATPAPRSDSTSETSDNLPSPASTVTASPDSYYGDDNSNSPLEWGVNIRSGKRGKKDKDTKGKSEKPEKTDPILPDFEDRTLYRFEPDEFTFTIGVTRKVAEDFEFARKRAKIVLRNQLRSKGRNSKLFGKFLSHFIRAPKNNKEIKLKAARQVLQEKALANNESLLEDDLNTQADQLANKSSDVGHTWVEFTTRYQGRLKTLYSFGMVDGGVQHPDRTVSGQGISEPQFIDYKVSRKAYERAFNKAIRLYRRPPKYDVRDFNCTKFAQVLAQEAGVPFPAKAIVVPFYPDKGIKGIYHKAFMPGGLAEGIKGLQNVRKEATKEERTITEEEKEQERVYNQTLQAIQNQPKNITGTGRFKNLKTMEDEYLAGEAAQERVIKDGKEIGPMSYWRQRKNNDLGNLPVKYLDDMELEQHELTFNQEDDLFYWRGKVAHTEHMSQVGGFSHAEGRAIFVMTEDGKIYMADQGNEVDVSRDEKTNPQWLFHHSSFLHGKPVAAAGELIFVNGVLTGITDASGHYRPSLTYTRQVLLRFADDHVDLSKVEVTLTKKGPQMPAITVNAKELLDFDGDNEADFRRQGLLSGINKLLRENKFDEANSALRDVITNYSSQVDAKALTEISRKFAAANHLKYAAIWTITTYYLQPDASQFSTLESIARSLKGQGAYFEACRLYQWLYNRSKDPDHALGVVEMAIAEGANMTSMTWTSLLELEHPGSSQANRAKHLTSALSNLDMLGTRDDNPAKVPAEGEALLNR